MLRLTDDSLWMTSLTLHLSGRVVSLLLTLSRVLDGIFGGLQLRFLAGSWPLPRHPSTDVVRAQFSPRSYPPTEEQTILPTMSITRTLLRHQLDLTFRRLRKRKFEKGLGTPSTGHPRATTEERTVQKRPSRVIYEASFVISQAL